QGKLEYALTLPGRSVASLRDETIESIEYVGNEDVYDIETESHNFLTNNVVVHNCFIQSVNDDLVNEGGIMDLWVREARIFKFGAGSGSNFSSLRGEGERLSGGGRSSGLMSFLRVGDRAAGAITCERHLNGIMRAAHDESLPEGARLDPALNPKLRAAMRAAMSVGIPP